MSRLDDLPNELLELVCRCLDNEDLKNLSLTSQALKAIPRRVLFEAVDAVLWEEEWEEFMDFVRRGANSHGYVRKIRFHVQSPMLEDFSEDQFNHRLMDYRGRVELDDSIDPVHLEEKQYWEDAEDNMAADLGFRLPSPFERWKGERREVKDTIRSAFSSRTLPGILSKFPNLGSVVLISDGLGNDQKDMNGCEVRPSTYSIERLSSYEDNMFVTRVPCEPKGRWTNEYSSNSTRYIAYDVLRPFLSSFTTSQKAVALKELDISEINPFHPDLSESRPRDLLKWRMVLESVEKLSVFFTAAIVYPAPARYLEGRRLDGPGSPQQIAIQASSSLRELCIGWHQLLPLDKDDFECFARCGKLLAKHFPSLRSLSLCGFEVNVNDFQDFLGQHRPTLKQTCLHNILLVFPNGELRRSQEGFYLRDADRYVKEFLVWIVQNLDFQRVELSGSLWAVQRRPVQSDWTPPNEFDMDGAQPHELAPWVAIKAARTVGMQLGRAVATAEPPCTNEPDSDISGYDDLEARTEWIEGFFEMYVPFMSLGPDQMPSPPLAI